MSATGSFRVATAAYPVEAPASWAALADKLDAWVGEAARAGAKVALLPEYAGMEAALAGGGAAPDSPAWCALAADRAAAYRGLCSDLSRGHDLYLLGGSMPERTSKGLVMRAGLHAPDGAYGTQDKQILTPWERANTPLVSGAPLNVFETELGRIGILVCYDSEFPALAQALAADLLLVPSCTEALAGQTRVQVAARARALENQCIVALAPLVGGVARCELVDAHCGQAGIFAPPDLGFPEDGVLARGMLDQPGWVMADVDPSTLALSRAEGAVAPLRHRREAEGAALQAEQRRLSHNRP